jgi:hypothetical protein
MVHIVSIGGEGDCPRNIRPNSRDELILAIGGDSCNEREASISVVVSAAGYRDLAGWGRGHILDRDSPRAFDRKQRLMAPAFCIERHNNWSVGFVV